MFTMRYTPVVQLGRTSILTISAVCFYGTNSGIGRDHFRRWPNGETKKTLTFATKSSIVFKFKWNFKGYRTSFAFSFFRFSFCGYAPNQITVMFDQSHNFFSRFFKIGRAFRKYEP